MSVFSFMAFDRSTHHEFSQVLILKGKKGISFSG